MSSTDSLGPKLQETGQAQKKREKSIHKSSFILASRVCNSLLCV